MPDLIPIPTRTEAELRLEATRTELAHLLQMRNEQLTEEPEPQFPRSRTMQLIMGVGAKRWRELLWGTAGTLVRRSALWRYVPVVMAAAALFNNRDSDRNTVRH